ncbi:MAG: Holliday junction branch migration protein RuvA [Thomasclavelia sp.]|nr:Holliday junction branch migration protein RuvA [Thomasclavelia sp.]
MYSYLIGIITSINSNSVVVENNGIGYLIYVSNPYNFKLNKETKVFLYQQVKEDGILLFGFLTSEEKDLFLRLITVKGIGCKSAIGILATGEVNNIISAIETSNVAYLKKIPGIGPKAASQIILDLQGKFKGTNLVETISNDSLEEASQVLLALGYKSKEVDKVTAKLVSEDLDTNGYIKKALSMLVK